MTFGNLFRPGPLTYAQYVDNLVSIVGSDRAVDFSDRGAAVGVGLSASGHGPD